MLHQVRPLVVTFGSFLLYTLFGICLIWIQQFFITSTIANLVTLIFTTYASQLKQTKI